MAKAENEKSRLPDRRERLEEIQGFTLLSDVFASEALKDLPACQHVFRILTGKRELCLRGVKTQYSISRAATRGARLDVFAEDVEGNLYAQVRYLKCEEGGIEIMCDIAEKIEQRGREAGRLEAKHESACSLAEIGMPAEQIAKVLKESVSLVKKWIAEGAAPAK